MMNKDEWGNLVDDLQDRVQNVLNEFKKTQGRHGGCQRVVSDGARRKNL